MFVTFLVYLNISYDGVMYAYKVDKNIFLLFNFNDFNNQPDSGLKRGLLKIKFLTSQPKHMFLVLKRM